MASIPNESMRYMDVEMDGSGYTGHPSLKRYNSAPYINIPEAELMANC